MASDNRSRNARVGVASVAVVLPLVAGLCLSLWSISHSPLQTVRPAEPLIAVVDRAKQRDTEPVAVQLLPAQPFVVSSGADGVVTSASITVGATVATGYEPFSVNGQPLTIYRSDTPLYRTLDAGADGDDVVVAQQFLTTLGLLDEVTGIYDRATEDAVTRFNLERGSTASSTLDPRSLLWVPNGAGRVTEVSVLVGDRVADGTQLFSISSGQDTVLVEVDAGDQDRTLVMGSVEVTLAAGDHAITAPDDVAALRDLLTEGEWVPAELGSEEVREVGVVPASAVVVDAQGKSCLFPDVSGDPITVSTAPGGYGQVHVQARLVGQRVLINPRAVRDNLSCASS